MLKVVGRDGIEPPTRGFSVIVSTIKTLFIGVYVVMFNFEQILDRFGGVWNQFLGGYSYESYPPNNLK
jgi:hypothetical protein